MNLVIILLEFSIISKITQLFLTFDKSRRPPSFSLSVFFFFLFLSWPSWSFVHQFCVRPFAICLSSVNCKSKTSAVNTHWWHNLYVTPVTENFLLWRFCSELLIETIKRWQLFLRALPGSWALCSVSSDGSWRMHGTPPLSSPLIWDLPAQSAPTSGSRTSGVNYGQPVSVFLATFLRVRAFGNISVD